MVTLSYHLLWLLHQHLHHCHHWTQFAGIQLLRGPFINSCDADSGPQYQPYLAAAIHDHRLPMPGVVMVMLIAGHHHYLDTS